VPDGRQLVLGRRPDARQVEGAEDGRAAETIGGLGPREDGRGRRGC
jgi:hypothetical protein